MIVKILLLVGLIRLLLITNKPLVCSAIYTAVAVFFHLIWNGPSLGLLIVAPIAFGLSTLYFWLLYRFQDNTVLFWVICVVGLLIGLV